MAELPWFPMYARDWLSGEGTSMMLPEQEGAFMRLLCIAWGDGSQEPCLPDDDDALAQMSRLGRRWKRLGVLVRAQFTVRENASGMKRLYNAKLSLIWEEQVRKSQVLANNGRKGGKAKAALQQRHGFADSKCEADAKHTEADTESEAERATENSSLHGDADSVTRREKQYDCDAAIAELSALLTEVPGANDALTSFMEGLPSAAKRLVWARSLISSLQPISGGKPIKPAALVSAMADFNLATRAQFPYTGAVFRAFADKAMRDLETPAAEPRNRMTTNRVPESAADELARWAAETDAKERAKVHG